MYHKTNVLLPSRHWVSTNTLKREKRKKERTTSNTSLYCSQGKTRCQNQMSGFETQLSATYNIHWGNTLNVSDAWFPNLQNGKNRTFQGFQRRLMEGLNEKECVKPSGQNSDIIIKERHCYPAYEQPIIAHITLPRSSSNAQLCSGLIADIFYSNLCLQKE